ncbi:MAG: sugar ABC transporter substrate-binding protein [Candidatus Aerophobus sp.]|nr:MAG: sugar ABC transporter substrate-binding protein [Candidatus Aerophobus sp.]
MRKRCTTEKAIMAGVLVLVMTVMTNTSAAEQKSLWTQFSGKKIGAFFFRNTYLDGIKYFIPEFEKKTGIKVDLGAYSEQIALEKLGFELSAPAGAYDAAWLGGSSLPSHVKAGWAAPIQPFIDNAEITDYDVLDMDDFLDGPLNMMKYGDVLYGLPWFSATVIQYCRKDIFDKYGIAGPPDTIDEFVATVKLVDTPEIPGVALRGAPNRNMNQWHFPIFLRGLGGKYFRDIEKRDLYPVLDSPQAIEAARIYGELLREYGVPGAPTSTFDDVVIAMQQGKVVMCIEGAPLAGRILDPEQSKVVGKLYFALVPKGPAGRFPSFTGHGWLIPSNAQEKEAGWLFMQWATSRETLLKTSLNYKHIAVTRKSIWTDAAFVKRWGYAGGFLEKFMNSLEIGYPEFRPRIPEWPEVGDTVALALNQVIVGTKTAEEAFKGVNKEVLRIMKEAGYIK